MSKFKPYRLEQRGYRICSEGIAAVNSETGRTYLVLPALMYSLLILALMIWAHLNVKYNIMHSSKVITDAQDRTIYLRTIGAIDPSTESEIFYQYVEPIWYQLEMINHLFEKYFMVCGIIFVLAVFRIFQYFEFQPKLNVMTATFSKASNDMVHLFMVLMITCFGYAVAGHLLFGLEIKAFETYFSSVMHIFRMIFGLYAFKAFQIHYENPVLVHAYVFLFKLIVLLLLFKMLVVIIFSAYGMVKSTYLNKETQGVIKDMSDMSTFFFRWLSGKLKPGFVSPTELFSIFYNRKVKNLDEVDSTEKLLDIMNEAAKDIHPNKGANQYSIAQAEWVMCEYGKRKPKAAGADDEDEPVEMTLTQQAIVLNAFKTFDADGSGEIDVTELSRALEAMNHPSADDPNFALKVLLSIDADGSMTINFEEFLRFVAEDIGLIAPEVIADDETLMDLYTSKSKEASP